MGERESTVSALALSVRPLFPRLRPSHALYPGPLQCNDRRLRRPQCVRRTMRPSAAPFSQERLAAAARRPPARWYVKRMAGVVAFPRARPLASLKEAEARTASREAAPRKRRGHALIDGAPSGNHIYDL